MILRHISTNGSRGLCECKDGSIIYRLERSESAFSTQVSISSNTSLPTRAMNGTDIGIWRREWPAR